MFLRKSTLLSLFLLSVALVRAQDARTWADSIFKSLTPEEKIAQLIMVRLSSIDIRTRIVSFYDSTVERDIKKYNIGGICLFQGGPVKQASLVNYFQSIAKTPILIAIDGETGLGMRMDSVVNLPKMMMLGALRDSSVVYRYGQWVAEQCKLAGIQINFAPVVDVNNNPNNPVINDRSFGENKFKVANWAIQYMLGMRDAGIMGSAKHFPGHGDVDVDSHLAAPLISKSRSQLDSLELYPFKKIFEAGIGSAMVGHLFVPSIDTSKNHVTSISANAVTGLLKGEMGFRGITFTDALEMKGVAAEFPDGAAGVESLIAGNDMLCLPGDVEKVIAKTMQAIADKRITWSQIDEHVMKVLETKYITGLHLWKPIDTNQLADKLNAKSNALKQEVAEKTITVGKLNDKTSFPLLKNPASNYALLEIGKNQQTQFSAEMRRAFNVDVFNFDNSKSSVEAENIFQQLKSNYSKVIIAIHELPRYPANNFNMSNTVVELIQKISNAAPTNLFIFGNPYAAKSYCETKNVILAYDDDAITHTVAAKLLKGEIGSEGQLPVTICTSLPYGKGIELKPTHISTAETSLINEKKIDSIINDAIDQKAAPGMVLLAMKDGKVIMQKTYGAMSYTGKDKISQESVYDMASVTKICATTLAIMKLYDEKKISLDKTLGDYLSWTKGTDKEKIQIKDVLLHQAGLKAWIPFYKEIADSITMKALPGYLSKTEKSGYTIKVDDSLFLKTAWKDTMYSRILTSTVDAKKNYVYSDNDFILLGDIVKSVSGLSLDEYVWKNFYRPLGFRSTGFNPTRFMNKSVIAPTEQDPYFRERLIRGYVHDPGAAMFGGVSGHAGLFSNAYEIAVLMQMLMNNGVINEKRFISSSTIELFTKYQSDISRRGYGFDKPEKDNATRKTPYPSLSVSPDAFGHTGFTGTCTWADPQKNIVFVLLANRVHPTAKNTFGDLNVRGKVMEEVFVR
ncbi:MAG: glycoside hydrolase family 3 N-terminal domain-containing protein [Chitinophagaceae bacterium]